MPQFTTTYEIYDTNQLLNKLHFLYLNIKIRFMRVLFKSKMKHAFV